MDQYALSTLFKRFETALNKLNKRLGMQFAVKDCMLVRVQDGICEFMHMDTGLRLKFDTRTDSIVK